MPTVRHYLIGRRLIHASKQQAPSATGDHRTPRSPLSAESL